MSVSTRLPLLLATLTVIFVACGGRNNDVPPNSCTDPVGTAPGVHACDDPQAVFVGGADTGFVKCASGLLHRPKALACPAVPPRTARCVGPLDGGVEPGCQTDADCTASPNGRCLVYDPLTGSALNPGGCGCYYGCSSDADCPAGEICQCGDTVNTCAPASCASDADCGAGLLCASYATGVVCNETGFACQTPQDTCGGSLDCQGDCVSCGYTGSKRACISCVGP
jgi:hypothetical protein